MVGHPQGHRVEATRRFERDARTSSQNQSQRSRPEPFGQQPGRLRNLLDPVTQVLGTAEMDDQRMRRRTTLGVEDTSYGVRVLNVGAQTVDSLRRKGHQAPRAQDTNRLLNHSHSRNSPTHPGRGCRPCDPQPLSEPAERPVMICLFRKT